MLVRHQTLHPGLLTAIANSQGKTRRQREKQQQEEEGGKDTTAANNAS
jgi:hypothetical protein